MIKIKKANKGKLHKDLGIKPGKKISAGELIKARNSSDPAERKRAIFDQNAKSWNHKK